MNIDLDLDEFELTYALSKQVPAMRYEVRLETSFGELDLTGRDAERVAALVQKLLEAKLKKLQR